MSLIQRGEHRLLLGAGISGLSMARFCLAQGIHVHIVDDRECHAAIDSLRDMAPDYLSTTLGDEFHILCQDEEVLRSFVGRFSELLLSPGVPFDHPLVRAARESGLRVRNDISLFVEQIRDWRNDIRIVAVTGSNGKSTVTDGLAKLGRWLGCDCHAIGNIGLPVLDMLGELKMGTTFILELSSYQLELVDSLGADVAMILNLSEDHIDRHGKLENYWRAKQKIYEEAKAVIVNRDDALTTPLEAHKNAGALKSYIRYGLGVPDAHDFGLVERQGQVWLAHGIAPLIPVAELGLRGQHNVQNCLAMLATCESLGWPLVQTCEFLRNYTGLQFRCELEATTDGIDWLNDSKGTKVGATLAALEDGLSRLCAGRLWWIGGGLTKGAKFDRICHFLKTVSDNDRFGGAIIYGQDRAIIAECFDRYRLGFQETSNLAQAVATVRQGAKSKDVVVFSPACASMDQFKNFEARGREFSRLITQG